MVVNDAEIWAGREVDDWVYIGRRYALNLECVHFSVTR